MVGLSRESNRSWRRRDRGLQQGCESAEQKEVQCPLRAGTTAATSVVSSAVRHQPAASHTEKTAARVRLLKEKHEAMKWGLFWAANEEVAANVRAYLEAGVLPKQPMWWAHTVTACLCPCPRAPWHLRWP